jgi:hypothetical protein
MCPDDLFPDGFAPRDIDDEARFEPVQIGSWRCSGQPEAVKESGQKCGRLELRQQAFRSFQTGMQSSLACGTKARSEREQAIGR